MLFKVIAIQISFLVLSCTVEFNSIPGPKKQEIRNYMISTSQGLFYKSEKDGIEYRPIIPQWRNTGSRTFNIGYGNIYNMKYVDGALTAVGDLGHLFVSFDRGETWEVNQSLEEENTFADLLDMDFGQNHYIAIFSRTGILIGTNGSLGKFKRVNCEEFTLEAEGARCNLFLKGIKYFNNYWVMWGAPPVGFKISVAYYSVDNGRTWNKLSPFWFTDYDGSVKRISLSSIQEAHVHINGRWYFLIDDKLLISRSGNPISSEDNPYRLWKVSTGVQGRRLQASSFSLSEDGRVALVGVNHYYYGEKGEEIKEYYPTMNHRSHKVRYQSEIWRILTGDGVLHYSADGINYDDIRYGIGALNDILAY